MEMILAATNWDPRNQVIRIAPGDDYDEQSFESDDEDMDPAEPDSESDPGEPDPDDEPTLSCTDANAGAKYTQSNLSYMI